jgi:hypothetical protein
MYPLGCKCTKALEIPPEPALLSAIEGEPMSPSKALDDAIFLASIACAVIVRLLAAIVIAFLCCLLVVRTIAALAGEKLSPQRAVATATPFDRR